MPERILYHGTNAAPFKEFQVKPGKRHVLFSSFHVETPGHFFATTPAGAKEFGRNVARVKVHTENPFFDPAVDKLWPHGRLKYEKHQHLARLVASAFQKDEHGHFIEIGVGKQYIKPREWHQDRGDNREFPWAYDHFDPAAGLPWDIMDHPKTTERLKKLGYDSTWVSEPDMEADNKSLYVPHGSGKLEILGWNDYHKHQEPEQMSRTDNSLPPEVSKDAIGNALANAAEAAQKPHGAVYASSSEREGSTLEHALENYKKDAHSGLLTTAARLGVSYPAIGTWSDGAEESSLTETHPEEVERVGSILGLKHRQKGVALFKPDEAGPDAQHIVSFEKPLPLTYAHKRLLNSGIEFATFLPTDHRPDLVDTIHVLSNGPEDTQQTAERMASAFQSEEGSDYFQNKGHVSVPSAPTREGAAKLFKALLQKVTSNVQ